MGTVGNISDTFHLQFKNGTAQFQGGVLSKIFLSPNGNAQFRTQPQNAPSQTQYAPP